MTTEENKMLVRRQFDEIWNAANWTTVDELFAPNYVNHDPYNPDQGTGPEGFKQRSLKSGSTGTRLACCGRSAQCPRPRTRDSELVSHIPTARPHEMTLVGQIRTAS
jgi:hypothetical protein